MNNNTPVGRLRKKQNPYTNVPNKVIQDKTLSLASRGFFALLLSLPDDWTFSYGGLMTLVKEKEKALKSCVKELTLKGYMCRVRCNVTYNDKTYSSYDWILEPTQEEFESARYDDPFLSRIEDFTTICNVEFGTEAKAQHPQPTQPPKQPKQKQPTEKQTQLQKLCKKDEEQKITELASENNISLEILEDFISYRKSIKKPLKTARPILMYLNGLVEIQNKNISISEAIELMKNREWQTVNYRYVDKILGGNGSNNQQQGRQVQPQTLKPLAVEYTNGVIEDYKTGQSLNWIVEKHGMANLEKRYHVVGAGKYLQDELKRRGIVA